MLRRNFINSIAVGSSIAALPNEKFLQSNPKNNFNLNYAPHFGMFKNSAGKNLIDHCQTFPIPRSMGKKENCRTTSKRKRWWWHSRDPPVP